MMRPFRPISARVTVLFVVMAWLAHSSSALAVDPDNPLRAADTSSPRGTLKSFRDACNEAYHLICNSGRNRVSRAHRVAVGEQIYRCLDMSEVPPAVAENVARETAVELKEVLDRISLPPQWEIPDAEMVQATEDREEITRWTIPETEITLAKVEEGPRAGEYLFSPQTVSRSREFYERTKHLPYQSDASPGLYDLLLNEPGPMIPRTLVRNLPDWGRARIYGQAVWQWVGLALALVVGLLVMALAYRIGRRPKSIGGRVSILRSGLTLLCLVAALWAPVMVKDFAAEQLKAMQGSFCPNLLFPYARQAISDLVIKGSFPPLYLAPINFDALYQQQLEEEKKTA